MNEADAARMDLIDKINREPSERELLEEKHGQVWTTGEATQDFSFESFLAPFAVVVRKSDNQRGTLMFQHSPRFYWGFEPAESD